jgi:hypothetical protein
VGDRAKRHHQVPRSYLNRFAAGDRVFVRRRDGGAFESSTLNVAVESGFYDVPEDGGVPVTMVEDTLALVDGAGARVLSRIDATGQPPGAGSDDRVELAMFVALQMTRTTEYREHAMFSERVFAWLGDRPLTEPLMAEYLETVHLGFPPRPREAEAALDFVTAATRDGLDGEVFGIRMMLTSAQLLLPRILALNWTVEVAGDRRFITSDSPVILWRKPSRRDEFQGIGIETAREVRIPLDPDKQLVLSTRTRATRIEVAAHRVRICNAEMARGSHRFVLGHPNSRPDIEALHLPARGPSVRFNLGPLYVDGPNGPERQEGEVLHMFVPHRSQTF